MTGGRLLAALAALALFLDLTHFAKPLLVTAKFDPHLVPYDRAIGRDAKIVRYAPPLRIGEKRAAWIGGYLNLYDRRFDLWTAAPLASQRYTALYERAMSGSGVPLLNAMSGGYILSEQPLPLPRLASVSGVVAYRNRAAMPLAYARGESGRLYAPSLLAFGTAFVHCAIAVPEASMMIVTQQRAAAWSVVVDGERTKLEGEGDFLAVKLARGRHDVIFKYRSTPLIAGALLTLLAIARMLLPKSFVKR
jgi:hypothetical protein